MDISILVDNDIERMRIKESARRARQEWRFRDVKARNRKVLTTVLATVLAFFLR